MTRGRCDGIGFMMKGTKYGFTDADDCRDIKTGALTDWAEQINTEANGAYREITPSGSGLRFIGTVKGPELQRRFAFSKGSKEGVELYRHCNRFVCVTGLELEPKCKKLSPIDELLDTLLARYDRKASSKDNKTEKRHDYDYLIKNGAAEGERSELFSGVVWHLACRGMSVDEITAELAKHPNGIAAKYKGRLKGEIERCFSKWTAKHIFVQPGKLPEIVDAAEKALLASEHEIYQRGLLVRPAIVPLKGRDELETKGWRLVPISQPYLVDTMTRSADFIRWDGRSRRWVRIDAPARVAQTLLARIGEWRAPVLAGVVNTPLMRADGSICETPGYDVASGLLYRPDGQEYPPVPKKPSKRDAMRALAVLREPIKLFPFVGAPDEAVALSSMLTVVARRSLPTAPLHGVDATVAGSGKGKLVDICSVLATGYEAPPLAQGKTEEELEKRLGSALLAGASHIALDNCSTPVASDFLCMLLTQPRIKIRPLGRTEEIELPSDAFLTATGNGLTFVGDLTRRSLRCSLDPKVERPELHEFDFEPVALARKRRGELVVAALTVMRAYQLSGERVKLPPFGSFEAWSQRVREALVWVGCADPCATVENIRADDPERLHLAAVLTQWREHLGFFKRYSSADIIKSATGYATNEQGRISVRMPRDDFKLALLDVAGYGDKINHRRLGIWLAKHEGRIVGGLRIVPKGHNRDGTKVWTLADK